MRIFTWIICLSLFFTWSCSQHVTLTEQEKNSVKDEVHLFMKTLKAELETVNAEAYKKRFLNSDELAVATQGRLVTSYAALCDTIDLHLSTMEKQSIQTVEERIFVINKAHAVISTSMVSAITFKNGATFTMPFAWTFLLVKRNGEWKIAHAHN